jgi:dTDP-4-amino-4,6-dideoxygalactose transaminase
MAVTEDVADRLVRLPLWSGIDESQIHQVVEALARSLGRSRRAAAAGRRG